MQNANKNRSLKLLGVYSVYNKYFDRNIEGLTALWIIFCVPTEIPCTSTKPKIGCCLKK